MNESIDPDAKLATRFEREHTHVPAEPFVAATLREIHGMQRRANRLRIALRVAALLAVICASPWLTAGIARLNAAVEFSLNWTSGQPVIWLCAAAGVFALLGVRFLRGR
jgi:hypothetical protein